jgi:hypothetical protein
MISLIPMKNRIFHDKINNTANAKTYMGCKFRRNVKQQRPDFDLDRRSTKEELALFIHQIRSYVADADAAMSFR